MERFEPHGAMSERTISPGLDLPAGQGTNTSLQVSSHARQDSGSTKRKWSSGHSDASSATITHQNEPKRTSQSIPRGQWQDRPQIKRSRSNREPTGRRPQYLPIEVPEDRSLLPGEIWQLIFTFLSPLALGRLLQVNKAFHGLLASNPMHAPSPQTGFALDLVDSEKVWSASRRAYCPRLPRPISSRSELDMWRLLRGFRCQFCRMLFSGLNSSESLDPWIGGPGQDFVRIVWPFAIRSCGECLRSRIRQDAEMLFLDCSLLRHVLPHAFLTPAMNYITSLTSRTESPPPGLEIIKCYFSPQVDAMSAELARLEEQGSTTAKDWFSDLRAKNPAMLENVAHWEQWETEGGFQDLARSFKQFERPPLNLPSNNGPLLPLSSTVLTYNGPASDKKPITSAPATTFNPELLGKTDSYLPASLPPTLGVSINSDESTNSVSLPTSSLTKPSWRLEAKAAAADEKKAARRAEIVRRAALLIPPVEATTLEYMNSFKAAMEIAMPLNDPAWDQLKPRIIAQHADALRQEQEYLAQDEIIQRTAAQNHLQDQQRRAAKESREQHWDECKKWVHSKLQNHAESFLRDQYPNAINRDSCQQFAADLLQHVRNQFFKDLSLEDARMRDTGHTAPIVLPDQASTRRLTLDDMRWVNDTYIRPNTDKLQKELFLCSECYVNNGKSYPLDSLIQHYASMHTEDFRMGSATVYWKSNWPESPPFLTNPTAARAARAVPFNIPFDRLCQPPGSAPPPGNMAPDNLPPYLHQNPAPPVGMINGSQSLPRGAFYDNAYGMNQYQAVNGAPPTTNYHPAPYADAAPNAPPPFPHQAGQCAPQQGFIAPAPQYPAAYPPPVGHEQPGRFRRPRSAASQVSYHSSSTTFSNLPPRFPRHFAAVSTISSPMPARPAQPNMYELQLREVVNNASELWEATGHISALSDSVRAQVIIEHVALRFTRKNTNEPSLSLFKEALHHSQLAPLREMKALTCKGCIVKHQTLGLSSGPVFGSKEGGGVSLPNLVAHFQSSHVEEIPSAQSPMRRLDWRHDMIKLPDKHEIRALMHTSSVTQTQLELIAEALPRYFPSPLPNRDPPAIELAAAGPDTTRVSGPITGGQDPSHGLDGLHSALQEARRHGGFDSEDGSAERRFGGPNSMEVDGPTTESTPRGPLVNQEDECDPLQPRFGQSHGLERPVRSGTATYDRHNNNLSNSRDQGQPSAQLVRQPRTYASVNPIDEIYSGAEDTHFPPHRRPDISHQAEMWVGHDSRRNRAENRNVSRGGSRDATNRFIQNFDPSPRREFDSPQPTFPPVQRTPQRPVDYENRRRQGGSRSEQLFHSENTSPASPFEATDGGGFGQEEGRRSLRDRSDQSYQRSDQPAEHYYSADASPAARSHSSAPKSHLRSVEYASDQSPRELGGRSNLHQARLPEDPAAAAWYVRERDAPHDVDSRHMRGSALSRRRMDLTRDPEGQNLDRPRDSYDDVTDQRDYQPRPRPNPPTSGHTRREAHYYGHNGFDEGAADHRETFYAQDGYLYERVPARSQQARDSYARDSADERR